MDAFATPIKPDLPAQTNIIQSEQFLVDDNKTEVPVSHYQDIYNIPYTAKFFTVNYELGAVREGVDKIESYILSQIENRGLKDDFITYDLLVNELFNKIGVEVNQRNDIKFNKLVQYLTLLERNKSVDERKQALLKRKTDLEKLREEKRQRILAEKKEEALEKKNEILERRLERSNKQKQILLERQRKVKSLIS